MNIRSIIFACIVGMAAIAATHEIDQEASYAEATAFVQSFLGEEMQDGSGMQKKESACQKVANDSIKDIQNNCANQLKAVKKLAKGKQTCCTRGRAAWCKAKGRQTASKGTGGTCKNQLSKVEATAVKFDSVKFKNLKPGKCGTFFKGSAYRNVKRKVDAKKRECTKINGATSAFTKGVRDAKTGQRTARRNCHASDKRSYNKAYKNAKDICESKGNKKMFTRAKHMLCVLSKTPLSKCNVGKIPSLRKTKYIGATCSAREKTQCVNPKIKGLRNRGGMQPCPNKSNNGSPNKVCWYKVAESRWNNGKVISDLDIALGEGIQFKTGYGASGRGVMMIGLASAKLYKEDMGMNTINYGWLIQHTRPDIYESGKNVPCHQPYAVSNCQLPVGKSGTKGSMHGTYSVVRCHDGTIRYYGNWRLIRKTGQSTIPPNEKAAFSVSTYSKFAAFKDLVKISANC